MTTIHERIASDGVQNLLTPVADEVLQDVSVVIPAYNEGGSIAEVLRRIPPSVGEILVVDGVSTDDTSAIARQSDARVRVIERTRTGKGNALACGFAAATKSLVVAMDADGSANPDDIANVIEPLLLGADFVKGHRVRDLYAGSPLRRAGTSLITKYFNRRLSADTLDVCCGFVAVRAACLAGFDLDSDRASRRDGAPALMDGFEIDAVIMALAVQRGLVIRQRAVDFAPRTSGESKTRPARDSLRILRAIDVVGDR